MEGGNTQSSAAELGFVLHSGTGVQYQSLLTAAFLANVTSSRLVMPPWLDQRQMGRTLWHMKLVGRSCNRSAEGTAVGRGKARLNSASEKTLCGLLCSPHKRELPTLAALFDLRGMVEVRPRACHDCGRCPQVHLDMALLSAKANGHCTLNPTCEASIAELFALRGRLAAQRTPGGESPPICLGPLNDWFFEAGMENPLERCAKTHGLARRLIVRGLPLHPRALQLLTDVIGRSRVPCSRCLYVRLMDRNATPGALVERLAAAAGAGILPTSVNVANRGASDMVGDIELVSNCAPWDRCLAAVEQAGGQIRQVRSWLIAHEAPREVEAVSRSLRIPQGFAALVWDQLRCARCSEILPIDWHQPSRRDQLHTDRYQKVRARHGVESSSSSFFQMMLRMHHFLWERAPG